jgi:hypothetical protein
MSTLKVTILSGDKHLKLRLMVTDTRKMQFNNKKSLDISQVNKVVLDNQDHLLSKELNASQVLLEKCTNLMILKNQLTFKDHGYILKIPQLVICKKAKLTKQLKSIMNFPYLSVKVKELGINLVLSLDTIDTRETLL